MADQPSLIPSAWAANNSTTETIPATTSESGKASWDQGFPVETSLPLSEGGIPPKYGDFNGVLNVLSQFCLFAQAGGQYAWSNTLDYSVGSIVLGTDGSIYRAAQVSGPSTTAVNPVGDTSGKWERIVSQSDINALEEDIQDAMDAASDAASNASAAQSAVTTLDANVVKKSGDQEIGGSKIFTSTVKVKGTGVIGFAVNNTSSTRNIDMRAQDNTNAGIWDTENSRWMIHALPSTVTEIQGGLTVTGDVATSTKLVGTLLVPSYYGPHRDVSDDLLRVYGGESMTTGPCLDLCGATRSVYAGYFKLQSPEGTYVLQGTPAGNLSWNGTTTGFSSDIRIKQNIAPVPDKVLDAWGRIDWEQFKYRDAVAEKGEGKARWHTGIVAQHVSSAMAEAGEDACAYGILCHEEWPADYDGKELIHPAGEQWMVRYTEALCMEAAYQRRRADRAEARITSLERRLDEMEAVLASLISPVGDETYAEPEQEQDAEQEGEE